MSDPTARLGTFTWVQRTGGEESPQLAANPGVDVTESRVARRNLDHARLITDLTQLPVNGDFEASFELKRPQPALLSLLASGYTPVYPCHVDGRTMRQKPIGTGPWQFSGARFVATSDLRPPRRFEQLRLAGREQERRDRAMADWLAEQPGVAAVHYPGRPDHPGHPLCPAAAGSRCDCRSRRRRATAGRGRPG